ncbi:N-6 DNA methylase [Nocardia sp. NPDC059091]|uniref:N-6 DNA methylase n=1 Tax=unclassified Nocardia TaxID=2637762 RepID=UPI0036C5BA1A
MESMDTHDYATDVVERIWRAYLPFQQGRNTFNDLTSMFAILLLARFIDTESEPEIESARRWARAVADARRGVSPLTDLRAAMRAATQQGNFPVPDLLSFNDRAVFGDSRFDDVPWVAPFLAALDTVPSPNGAVLQEACELLLERHVQENPYPAGEFYTPRGVVRLVVDLVAPKPGDRILDPACGTGGFLAAAAQRIASHDRVDGGSFEAHAMDHDNTQLALLNMALHGVDRPAALPANPIAMFQRRGSGLVDRVLSNPPFNRRIESIDFIDLPFGPPPESSSNFAWLQLAWTRLSENGTAAIIMPPTAAWSSGREAQIRSEMVARGAVLAIIALPPNLFRETAIPVHVWILAGDKARQLPETDQDKVLFIDAAELGTQVPRQPRTLTAKDAERVSRRFREWLRSPRTAAYEPGFSCSVSHEEILENAGSLDPRRYVDKPRVEPSKAQDPGRMLDDLDQRDRAIFNSFVELRDAFRSCRQKADNYESPRVALRTILSGPAILAGPSGSLIRAEDYVDSDGIPVVMPKDLTETGFKTTSIRYITPQQAEELKRFRLRAGDIVLARRGELGRCAVARKEQEGWVCGTGCFVLRLPKTLDPDYLAAYLRSPMSREWLEAHSTGGMNMKTISLNALGNLPVVLPDLERQRAIAEVMARLDNSERLVREQLKLAQAIRREALFGLL